MITTFDKYIKKRDHIIFFKLYSKFDVHMAAIEIVKKLKSIVFTVEQTVKVSSTYRNQIEQDNSD